ncbi:MAG TPA: carbohydrate-binding family 9-like protein [Bryobacteraceae bacterium]|nr:carbohydrate-binding family 9-like protein [Bryobacteraceae bacterium]
MASWSGSSGERSTDRHRRFRLGGNQMNRWILVIATTLTCSAQKTYDVYRAVSPVTIDGKLDERAWRDAPSMGDFTFLWMKDGAKEQTIAKLLWDDENLYVSWQAHDKHISAYVTQTNGPVYQDDCVEIFIAPNPEKVKNYYNFEINAIGAMLSQARADWRLGELWWEPEGMRYRTSFHGRPKKDELPEDTQWVVEAAIPLSNFARDAVHTPPRNGDVWRLNLQRLGGKTDAQYSAWSPLPGDRPNFHQPEAFGIVRFVNKPPK